MGRTDVDDGSVLSASRGAFWCSGLMRKALMRGVKHATGVLDGTKSASKPRESRCWTMGMFASIAACSGLVTARLEGVGQTGSWS